MSGNIEGVRAGVDWLSLTLRNSMPGHDEWYTNCVRYIEAIGRQGYEVKKRGLLGYRGVSAGNCFIGERDDDSYLQLTGSLANDGFARLYGPDTHVSRIDVQVTVKLREMTTTIAKEAYEAASATNSDLPANRRRKLTLFVGSDGGDTVYIGSPTSDQRGRIYNKEIQSEDPRYTKSWRYEAVFRNAAANAVAYRLFDSATDYTSVCSGIVVDWFARRGVVVTWADGIERVVLPLIRTLPTDVETKLRWLETQVAPSVRYLCELGFRATLLEMLFPAVGEADI